MARQTGILTVYIVRPAAWEDGGGADQRFSYYRYIYDNSIGVNIIAFGRKLTLF